MGKSDSVSSAFVAERARECHPILELPARGLEMRSACPHLPSHQGLQTAFSETPSENPSQNPFLL